MQDILLKQSDLEVVLKAVFPEHRIISNSRKLSNIINPQNKNAFELDVWLPEIKLAFEFQDPYHYTSSGIFRDLPTLQKRDYTKKAIAEKKGITLIPIPCWWDGKTESLVGTIKFYRKDLLLDYKECLPIPSVPPHGYFDDVKGLSVPGIGDLMSSSSVPPSDIAPFTWWISEKYDGYRAFWHYEHDTLYTRWGRKIEIDDNFLILFPKLHLDGEIWAGRGQFEKAMQTMKKNENHIHNWEHVRYVVFDSLQQFVDTNNVYEKRFFRICSISDENPIVIPATCILCKSKQHMKLFMENILRAEGEGIIMRKMKSMYEHGRSNTLVKLKAIRDQEALCVEVLPNSYLLKLPNEITFEAILKDEKNTEAPKPGDVVTFIFKFYSASGQPNGAEILKSRKDLLWEDVLLNDSHSPSIDKLNEMAVSEKKLRHRWVIEEDSQVKTFLNKFLTEKLDRDPLLPESWYDVTVKDLQSQPWGMQVLRHYGWNMQTLLTSIYPSLCFDFTRFGKISKKFWDDPNNMRKYLDQIAIKKGFDPLIADNWYNFASNDLFNVEKGYLLQRHGGYKKVLASVYGKYGVKESMFDTVPMNYYESVENRRKFFEKVVKGQGLDPSNMEDWYYLSSNFVHSNGGQHILKRYNRNMYAVVKDIFPNHEWDDSRFVTKPKNYWTSSKIRQFFDNYAKQNNFDPLVAKNWYTIIRANFTRLKDAKSILTMFFDGSYKKAVMSVYPEIKFNVSLFAKVPANFWKSAENGRLFFDTFAKKRGFDPLLAQNWYNIPRHAVEAEKGGRLVLANHGDSMIKSLKTLYPDVAFDLQKFPNIFHYKKFL